MRNFLRPASDAFLLRHIVDFHGGVLIAAVVAILLVGVLGAGVVSMVGTSSQEEVRANHGERAFLLAESGFRYAESVYKSKLQSQGKASAKTALLALHNQTKSAPGGGTFNLQVIEHVYGSSAVADGSQTIYEHKDIVLNPGFNLTPYNGVFLHNESWYRYREFDKPNNTLKDVIQAKAGAVFPIVLDDNQNIDYFYSDTIEILSTGVFPDSDIMKVSRRVAYWWPLQSAGGGGGEELGPFSGGPDVWEDFDDGTTSFYDDQNDMLGSFEIYDGSMNVSAVQNDSQAAFLTIYNTSNVNMNSDYELQAKVKVADGSIHMAGITFRKQVVNVTPSQRKSYGLSFLRGGGDKKDGIPDLKINDTGKLYLVLWEAPKNAPPAGKTDVIAYKEIKSDYVFNNGVLADWSTLLVRIRQEENCNLITAFYTDASGSSTTGGDTEPRNKVRKRSPRDGITPSKGQKYLPWPPNDITNWTPYVDYLTLVTWDWVNPDKAVLINDKYDPYVSNKNKYGNIVIKTPEDELTFTKPAYELGLHAFGITKYITDVSFDDFAFRLAEPENGPDVYIPPIVLQ
ncbi:hypothetical protein [Desulfatiglans anilini]|uniref:hypothetical protein n=1 Tax=Desulfatiglans anilini TaxID=90728 RepID=UPI00040C5600|nr:hypothetical protein [Desulfatiglans anilini]